MVTHINTNICDMHVAYTNAHDHELDVNIKNHITHQIL